MSVDCTQRVWGRGSTAGKDAYAWGPDAHAGDFAIALGEGTIAELGGVAIGGKSHAHPGQVVINNMNFTDMYERILKLEALCKAQQETLEALWYSPGNPGAREGAEMFKVDSNKCDSS